MIAEKIARAPGKSGVYIFRGSKNNILYVGKAKNLKKRLKSYFQKPGNLDPRKSSMVRLVSDFTYIITKNELEALVLEANLIKQYKPRFNIVLRDDKNYPYLKLTIREEWPRLEVVRKIERDGALYFGPYVPAQGMWEALAFIRKNFPIRICKSVLDKPMRPCIQYQLGRCGAPCSGRMTREEYMKIVEEIVLFLKGEKDDLLYTLEKKMLRLSDELKFEEAARIRDRIRNLKLAWESQKVVAPELGDIDVIGHASGVSDAVFYVFFIRNGILVGTRDFYLKGSGGLPVEEVLHSFMEMFYAKEIIPPAEIIVSRKPEGLTNLRTWLTKKRGGGVQITTPKEGKKAELLGMAEENALQTIESKNISGGGEIVRELMERLHLPRLPKSIGAFDVSTIAGSESVGAFIFWSDGDFRKDLYRRLRVREVSGVDDYAMMHEVVTRTLGNLAGNIPDLIVIDGGKGQLEIARNVIEMSDIKKSDGERPMLISVAKDPDRAFTLLTDVVDLEDRSPSSLLLKKIRDEAHRFAVSYHRKLRDKRMVESLLERISGIGKKRRLELLRYFGSIDAIRNAPAEEIASLKGLNRKIAETVLRELKRP